jgi:hypothetical protein
MSSTSMQNPVADIQALINAGEARIAELHVLLHAAVNRVLVLQGCLRTLAATSNDIDLARVNASLRKLKGAKNG